MKAVNYILNGEERQSTNPNAIMNNDTINMDFLPHGAMDARIVNTKAPEYLKEEYEAMCEMYGKNSLEALSVKDRMNS